MKSPVDVDRSMLKLCYRLLQNYNRKMNVNLTLIIWSFALLLFVSFSAVPEDAEFTHERKNETIASSTSNGNRSNSILNPTLLSDDSPMQFLSNTNATSLDPVLQNQVFKLPDLDWVKRNNAYASAKLVVYPRDKNDIIEQGSRGNCTASLDVLAWLLDAVNKEDNSVFMVAYGGLIHLHREGGFVNNATGKWWDDDLDTFVSLDTMIHIAALEKHLFYNFGWTIRYFVSKDKKSYINFAQVFAVCGHTMEWMPNKVRSSQPPIELYPIVTVPGVGNENTVKDLWTNSKFPESMIFPQKHMTVHSASTAKPLHLQVPHQSIRMLECLYGNWKVPSGEHVRPSPNCM